VYPDVVYKFIDIITPEANVPRGDQHPSRHHRQPGKNNLAKSLASQLLIRLARTSALASTSP
jgi:hypothetical protein